MVAIESSGGLRKLQQQIKNSNELKPLFKSMNPLKFIGMELNTVGKPLKILLLNYFENINNLLKINHTEIIQTLYESKGHIFLLNRKILQNLEELIFRSLKPSQPKKTYLMKIRTINRCIYDVFDSSFNQAMFMQTKNNHIKTGYCDGGWISCG